MDDQTTYLNYAPAADRNKAPIWSVLNNYLKDNDHVLEVGSGSGQHALYFCSQNPTLKWQCADQQDYEVPLKMNLEALNPGGFTSPIVLDVQNKRHVERIKNLKDLDVVYTANTLHIMNWDACLSFFSMVGSVLRVGGRYCIYGPFLYEDRTTTESNLQFNEWLRQRNAGSAIRSFEDVVRVLNGLGFELLSDIDMPANNQLLVFQKQR